MPQDKVLVTGASGMVGNLLARQAIDAGYRVRGLVRSKKSATDLAAAGVELVEGDLAQVESVTPALRDVDIVVHTAAHVGDWGPAETFRAINVYALEHMLTTVQREGRLRRWIQVSSLGVYAAEHHHGTDETVPPDVEGLDGYTRTKAEAEYVLRHYIDEFQFPGVILRPGFMYGPGDRHVVPRLIENITAGKMKIIGDGQKVLNNTYVGNFVDAILLAMESDKADGHIFNVRDARLVTRTEFIAAVCDRLGKPDPRHVPEWIARGAVGWIEGFAKLLKAKKAPLLTQARIKFMTLNLDFSIAKAQEILGYQPRVDFREGIEESLDWATGETPAAKKAA